MRENNLKFERVHIELTNHCNFSCDFCPDSIMQRRRGHMDFGLFRKIIDEVAQLALARKVLFHLMGEPLLYPQLVEAVEYARQKALNVYLTTNASLLTKEKVKDLLCAGLKNFILSLQTPDERTFKLRGAKGIDFLGFSCNISEAAQQILKTPDTSVTVSFLTSPWNIFITPRLSAAFKASKVISSEPELYRHLIFWIKQILDYEPQNLKETLRKGFGKFACWKENAVQIGPRLKFETRLLGEWKIRKDFRRSMIKTSWGYCPGLSEHFGILYNGDVVFCCTDYEGNTQFGNLNNQGLSELLNSEMVKRVRVGFRKCRVVHPFCQYCLGGQSLKNFMFYPWGSIFYFKLYRKLFKKNIALSAK